MATKHWARDAYISDPTVNLSNGNQVHANSLVFHFLRNAGFSWLWECDGETYTSSLTDYPADSNHVEDGSMEDSGTSKYSGGGSGPGLVSKNTTTVKSGTQSLRIASQNAGDWGQTIALRNMRRAGNGNISGTAPNMRMDDAGSGLFSGGISGNVTFVGAVNPGNNGTFPITSYFDQNSINFNNASGASESGVDWATDEPYEVVLWAYNNSSQIWDVDVDRGDGSWTNIGTIPINMGVWTQYHFTFTLYPGTDAANPRYIRFRDPSTGSQEIYIDGLQIFRSMFEYYPGNQYGTDGILTNPDRFSTGGSYTPGSADVGKWLFVWDPANPGNSGWYKITTDIGGGVVDVDLRSPTAAFTSNTGLNYRIVDVEGQCYNIQYDNGRIAAGFGIESPHTSKWRFFARQFNSPGSVDKGTVLWGAPVDVDFDVDTGQFYSVGPSTGSRNGTGPYHGKTISIAYRQLYTRGQSIYSASPTVSRTFLITDADLSFFSYFHGGSAGVHGCFFAGYTGADPSRPGNMEWMIAAPYSNTAFTTANEADFSQLTTAFSTSGTGIGSNDLAVETTFSSDLGYFSNKHVFGQTNAGANPWSGKEWLQKPIVAIDPEGKFGQATEGDVDCGIYRARNNMAELYTFDSHQYLHLDNGLVWEWSGEQLSP